MFKYKVKYFYHHNINKRPRTTNYTDFIDIIEHTKYFNIIFIRGNWIYKGPKKLVNIEYKTTDDIINEMYLLNCTNDDIETALFLLTY